VFSCEGSDINENVFLCLYSSANAYMLVYRMVNPRRNVGEFVCL